MAITDNMRQEFWNELTSGGSNQDFVLGDNDREFFVYCTKEELVSQVPESWDGEKVNVIFCGPIMPATT